jgi:hypothetical protein
MWQFQQFRHNIARVFGCRGRAAVAQIGDHIGVRGDEIGDVKEGRGRHGTWAARWVAPALVAEARVMVIAIVYPSAE